MLTQAQFLSPGAQQIIHDESLRILMEVGTLFHSQKAFDILARQGAKVDSASRTARMPPEMVNQALETSSMMTLEQSVVDDEIACFYKRIRDGINLSAGKNRFDDIREVNRADIF